MGKERDASWYDDVYASAGSLYAALAAATPWYGIWLTAVFWLNGLRPRRIVDLGCGVGHLAQMIRLAPNLRDVDYLGIDFSPVALKKARARAPQSEFRCVDLSLDPIVNETQDPDGLCVVSCEFLEHVEFDLEILSALAPGVSFLGSVPKNDDCGHVRWFANEDLVRDRYEPLFTNFEIFPVGRLHFVFVGCRSQRPDDNDRISLP
ncbi:MAG: class I SAM-dependent methyltransferase [Acidobacteria bacterium]|nr:class I SAM-dependent methyltransferase [Acidobacteriota bacterium]